MTTPPCPCRPRGGFSLVEVNLAILMVALGLLVLFGVFPSGLKQGDIAVSETHAAIFADFVLAGVEANAMEIPAWTTWSDASAFRTAAVNGLKDDALNQILAQPPPAAMVLGPVTYASGKLNYVLEIGGNAGAVLRPVSLWVFSGEHVTGDVAAFKKVSDFFYTELCFQGAMP